MQTPDPLSTLTLEGACPACHFSEGSTPALLIPDTQMAGVVERGHSQGKVQLKRSAC